MKRYFLSIIFHLKNLRSALLARKYRAYSMVPVAAYVNNLDLSKKVRNVPGCVVECGVWRGGQIAGIAETLGKSRTYFLFDSFEGLLPAQTIDGKSALHWQQNTDGPGYYDNCKAEMRWAEAAMQKTGCPDFQLVKGWFQDTLPTFQFNQPIALLRLDADWYDSTMTCLEHLFPKVAPGGIVIIDDYHTWDGCSRAVHDYLSRQQRIERIAQYRDNVCYIVKK